MRASDFLYLEKNKGRVLAFRVPGGRWQVARWSGDRWQVVGKNL